MTNLSDLKSSLGIPESSVKFETGSYIGTGTYGASNPTSLACTIIPYVIIILPTQNNSSTANTTSGYTILMRGSPISAYIANGGRYYKLVMSWGSNTVSWYTLFNEGSEALYQLNSTNYTYYWIAIGI